MTKPLRTPADLIGANLAPLEKLADLARVAERYAVAITPSISELIDRNDPRDPIARQFVPDIAELTTTPDERADPIGDDAHSPVEGIVHRYPDRVLLKLVNVCAVYCRFCFRREMVGPGKQMLTPAKLDAALGLHQRASRDLGGHPHRRRSAGALGAAARRRHANASPPSGM